MKETTITIAESNGPVNNINIQSGDITWQKIADQLHESRINNAIKLSKEIELEMSELNMAGSTFEILINTKPDSESLRLNFLQDSQYNA